jgi:alpha-beta hydrolase superfamily lysophospholipase
MPDTQTEIVLPMASPLPAAIAPKRKIMELADGYRTPVYVHLPPKGTAMLAPVVYLHGIQSHPGWFCGSAAAMARTGHAVFQVTRRGSGESTDARGHAASAAQLLDDIAVVARLAMKATSVPRVHLVGASWGGKLAAVLATRPPNDVLIASLTMIAPGIISHVDVRPRKKLLIAAMALVRPTARFKIPLNDVKLFTDNPPMIEYLEHDGYRLKEGTARFMFASVLLDLMLRRAREGCLTMPTTLLLAARDRIVDNVATRKVVIRLTAGHAVVEEFDAAHTLEFEPNPRLFFASLCDALKRAEK